VADFNQINQFGSAKPVRSGEGTSCAECEAMLMDALDGVLSAKDQAAFDLHIATCAECSHMLADARRGAALLEMLKSPRPEPSSALLERILAQTGGLAVPSKSAPSGVIAIPSMDGAAVEINSVIPIAAVPANVLPFRPRPAARFSLKSITHTMMQPRLAMTAAMAFFSITLTLNLTGIHLSELKASDLSPSNLKHSFYHANASVVRYYDNLRVVYELESRVNELKRTSDSDNPPPNPQPMLEKSQDSKGQDRKTPGQDKPRKTPKSGSGTSQRLSPLDQQFKLAGYSRKSSLDRSITGSIAFTRPVHKLKETPQEGDLV